MPLVAPQVLTMDSIYLDFNATTPMLPAVWQAMEPFFTTIHGNPASAHTPGRRARQALEDARERLAHLLGAYPDEVLFTSGATEGNNLALFGLLPEPGTHLLASPIEHSSIIEPLRQLQRVGFHLDWLKVDAQGLVHLEALRSLLRPETRLVCVQLANHEMGAVQPIQQLVNLLPVVPDAPIHFHCDAVQAMGKIPLNFHALGVSTLTLSGHKFHGPKGVGALLVRRDVTLRPRTWGGHQQRGLRPGTEPVALAVGLTTALEHACREQEQRLHQVRHLRDLFLSHLREHAAPVVLNGPERTFPDEPRAGAVGLPHTLNLSFPGLKADLLLMNLDLAGVACSTGSACSSGSLLPSPVLQAMGVPDDILRSAMRFSLSHLLTETEVREAAQRIAQVVQRLRT